MFEFFQSSEAKKLGSDIAKIIIDYDKKKSRKIDDKYLETRYASINRLIELKIKNFSKQGKLNFYQKAQMGNTIRWMLTEAGYDGKYAEQLVMMIMKWYR